MENINIPPTIQIPSPASDFFENGIQIENQTNATITLIFSPNEIRINNNHISTHSGKNIVDFMQPKSAKFMFLPNSCDVVFITALTQRTLVIFGSIIQF